MLVHYINISRVTQMTRSAGSENRFCLPHRDGTHTISGTNIQGQMEQVDTDYTWDSYSRDPNSVRISVNWGYIPAGNSSISELMVAIAAFLSADTGYLIIYNIFSWIPGWGYPVLMGLLKTIGTTPCKQTHQFASRYHHHQHIAFVIFWFYAVRLVDGALVLFQARKMQGLSGGLPRYGCDADQEKTAQRSGEQAPSDGLCQSGTKQEKTVLVVVSLVRR